MRVFYDRLVDTKDRTWFLGFLKSTLQSRFATNFDTLFSHLLESEGKGAREVGVEHVRSCFFGDYLDASSGAGRECGGGGG